MNLVCPECGKNEWVAIEASTIVRPVTLALEDDELIIEMDPFSEFEIDFQTTTTIAYKCAWQLCPFRVTADKMVEFAKNQKD